MTVTIRIPWARVPYGYAEYVPAEGTQTDWKAVMAGVKAAEDAYIAVFGAPQSQQTPQNRPQRPQSGGGGQRRPQQGGRGQGRAERYAPVDGECDICGGPVGRYPRTGNMRSDKAVCLGTCKDGDYVHTAFWLDEDNGGDDDYDGGPDPDDLPFD